MPDHHRVVSPSAFRRLIHGLWVSSRPLTFTGLLMLPLLALALIGVALDGRLITGAPAWLKPAKFSASVALYAFTLAWIFGYLTPWTRTRRIVGRMSATALIGEVAVIAVQAARGVPSHFNTSSAIDGLLFTLMGAAIVVQTLTSVAVIVALWRQAFEDRAFGWALRFAMTITVLGAFAGGVMTRPTRDQLAASEQARPSTVGAHTVGAPDGGPGLPGTGWSTHHGDLRVAHFAGLHALQFFPVLAIAMRRLGLGVKLRTRLTAIAATSYLGFVGLLLWQALRGEPLLSPGTATMQAVAMWAVMTAVGSAAAVMLDGRRAAVQVALQAHR